MTETDTWLSLGEAAAATGWKPERIRSLARRGTIERQRGNGRDWLYQVTPELVAARVDTPAGPSADTDEAARWQLVATELQEEVAELQVALGRAEERVAARDQRLVDMRDQLDREIARVARLEEDLRRPFWRRWLT